MLNITIPEYVAVILNRLANAGHEARVVGGCVRDTILGRAPEDWDVCTSALPEQIRAVFGGDHHVIDTGIKHGTVTVVSHGHPIEITTYRTESGYTDHRRPDRVTFVSNLEEDLARRDFTVNAMAYGFDCGLIDLFGGCRDIDRRIIRCVGDPGQRFGEDALRILRALRFAAVLDFDIDGPTGDAARQLAGLLGDIAVERIYIELKKLGSASGVERVADEYGDIMAVAAGSVPNLRGSAAGADTAVAFCLLFEDAAAVLARLKAPKAVIASAAALQKEPIPETLADALRLMGRIGEDDFRRYMDYAGRLGKDTFLLQAALDSGLPYKISQLAIGGKELENLGISPGPDMGNMLSKLLDAVIEGKVANQRESLKLALFE